MHLIKVSIGYLLFCEFFDDVSSMHVSGHECDDDLADKLRQICSDEVNEIQQVAHVLVIPEMQRWNGNARDVSAC